MSERTIATSEYCERCPLFVLENDFHECNLYRKPRPTFRRANSKYDFCRLAEIRIIETDNPSQSG